MVSDCLAQDSLADSCTSWVFVVIPVYNRLGHTLACLESLAAQRYAQMTVIVVDDGSTDGTALALRDQYPQVVLLRGNGNLWWSGATNMGIEWAMRHCGSSDYVLTLNNDTTVGPGYIASLLSLALSTEPSIVGSVSVDSVDERTIVDGGSMVAWTSAKWWSINRGRSLQDCLREGIRFTEPSCLPGRGTLIPVDCLHRVGLFDARRLPHYAADYEFSIRAARAGYRLLMSYEAPVISDVEATGISIKQHLPWRKLGQVFFSRRSPSCLLYRWRFAVLAAPRRVLPLSMAVDTARVLIGAVRDCLVGGRS
jgi:GT2 family glycosyltransferase